MFQIPNILDNLKNGSHKKIKGTVVLMKNNVLDFNDFHASVLDRVHELLGKGVSLQLINVGDSCEFSHPIFAYLASYVTEVIDELDSKFTEK